MPAEVHRQKSRAPRPALLINEIIAAANEACTSFITEDVPGAVSPDDISYGFALSWDLGVACGAVQAAEHQDALSPGPGQWVSRGREPPATRVALASCSGGDQPCFSCLPAPSLLMPA